MSATPNLQLPFLDANQNQKHVTHNAALSILDVLVNPAVQSNALAAPPCSPGDGQCWIVAAGAREPGPARTGRWWRGRTGLELLPPKTGLIAFAGNLGAPLVWSGAAWAALVPAQNPVAALVQALIFG